MGIWRSVQLVCDGSREWDILFGHLRNLDAHLGRPVNLNEAAGNLSHGGFETRPPCLRDELVGGWSRCPTDPLRTRPKIQHEHNDSPNS